MLETILIVDESRLGHVMLDDGLSTEGCERLHAYDADQGFWLAKRAQPDLVLLDVVMPRASGFELCKALRNDRRRRRLGRFSSLQPASHLAGSGIRLGSFWPCSNDPAREPLASVGRVEQECAVGGNPGADTAHHAIVVVNGQRPPVLEA